MGSEPASWARSRARRSGIRSPAQPKRSTTRASIAGSPSTAPPPRRRSEAPRARPRRGGASPPPAAALASPRRHAAHHGGARADHAADRHRPLPRRYGLKNRERLNRLLMLLQLHVNGDDDVQRYATTIRRWLAANGGRPIARRRALADPLGSPSLR